jgi:hypothetical protein
MTDFATQLREMRKESNMSETEEKLRLAIGSAAAAAAIFAPLSYKWKGVLTAVAAEVILSGIWGMSPVKRLLRA